jgi:hypothetical protein
MAGRRKFSLLNSSHTSTEEIWISPNFPLPCVVLLFQQFKVRTRIVYRA